MHITAQNRVPDIPGATDARAAENYRVFYGAALNHSRRPNANSVTQLSFDRGPCAHLRTVLHQVSRRFQERIERSRVEPSALIDPRSHVTAPVDQHLNRVGNFKLSPGRWLQIGQHVPDHTIEEVHPLHGKVRFRLLRFFHQFDDAFAVGIRYSEARWVFHGFHQVEVVAAGFVKPVSEGLQRRSINAVPQVHHEILTTDKFLGAPQRMGKALGLVLNHVRKRNANVIAVSQSKVHFVFIFSYDEAYIGRVYLLEAIENIVKRWASGKREERFSDVAGDRVEPRSLSRGQNNGFHKQRYLERCATDGAMLMRITAYGWGFVAILAVCGCGKDVHAELPDPAAGIDTPAGNDGYKTYVSAAKLMEERGAKYIGRTSWSPDQRDAIVAAAREPLAMIDGLSEVQFARTWEGVLGVRPNTRGWRTMGRALAWKIDLALKNDNHAVAIQSFLIAVRMSNALATSDSQDADIGNQIVLDCLGALWPALPKFGAGELSGFSNHLTGLLNSAPKPDPIVAQERAAMFAGISWVQDRYQKRAFEEISTRLGSSVGPAVKYLRELAQEEPAAQIAYFDGFKQEMQAESDKFRRRLETAPTLWQEGEKQGIRAWQRFVKAFATSWRVYAERRAQVRTRLRLLALDASLLASFKSSSTVPRTLAKFPSWLRTDPFSGRDFAYVPRGVDYKLYSFGSDHSDDGGNDDDIGLGR